MKAVKAARDAVKVLIILMQMRELDADMMLEKKSQCATLVENLMLIVVMQS